jgi:hypothetical protein
VKISAGDRLTITAIGRWSNAGPPIQGPDGFLNYLYPGTMLESANLASLIGKLGESIFGIGSRLNTIATRSGVLFLSMNDTPGTFADNQGRVEVTIQRR